MNAPKVALRVAEWNERDLSGIWDLCRQTFDIYRSVTRTDFLELYRHRWLDNPARTEQHTLGWVLDTPEDGIAGFVGMVPVRMKLGDREVVGASGTTFAVLSSYRAYSVSLYKKFTDWGNQQLLIDVTSGEVGNKLHTHLKQGLVPIPVGQMDHQFFWPIRPEIPVRWMLEKSRWKTWAPLFGQPPFSWLLRACAWAKFRCHRRVQFSGGNLPVESVEAITDEYTRFWEAHKHQYGITTVRDQRYLQWRHIDVPPAMNIVRMFACREKGQLNGYLSLMERNPEMNYYPGHFRVIDLFYDRTRPEVLQSLMNHAFEVARAGGGSLFEVSGMSPEVMDQLRSQRPYEKLRGSWPYWYKTPSSDLADVASKAEWWPSSSDGDSNL